MGKTPYTNSEAKNYVRAMIDEQILYSAEQHGNRIETLTLCSESPTHENCLRMKADLDGVRLTGTCYEKDKSKCLAARKAINSAFKVRNKKVHNAVELATAHAVWLDGCRTPLAKSDIWPAFETRLRCTEGKPGMLTYVTFACMAPYMSEAKLAEKMCAGRRGRSFSKGTLARDVIRKYATKLARAYDASPILSIVYKCEGAHHTMITLGFASAGSSFIPNHTADITKVTQVAALKALTAGSYAYRDKLKLGRGKVIKSLQTVRPVNPVSSAGDDKKTIHAMIRALRSSGFSNKNVALLGVNPAVVRAVAAHQDNPESFRR